MNKENMKYLHVGVYDGVGVGQYTYNHATMYRRNHMT